MKSEKQVRVRFAPSPTGRLHVGGLRAALFNILFARHYGGSFLVRIEDTDVERSLDIFTQEIISSLEWSDIIGDEPLVIQSHNIEYHRSLIQKLLETNNAYRCYCPTNPDASGETYYKYDGKCRVLNEYHEGKPFVIRLKLPLEKKSIAFNDLIRGLIEFDVDQFDDFIIVRSDGTPMYNFVVVADDATMGITHVIRGEEHIPNTPKQIFIYQALGFSVPEFAHLPLILSPSGQKLSKRDAAVAVSDYIKSGYLSDALCNYLVRLGWAHGDQEIFSRAELIQYFTLEGIGKKGAIFDQAKLDWVNTVYIKEKTAEYLLACIERDVAPGWRALFAALPDTVLHAALELYKDRVTTLRQMVDELTILFGGPTLYNEADIKKCCNDKTVQYIEHVQEALSQLSSFTTSDVEVCIKQYSKELNVSLALIAQPVRIALVGKTSSPGIFALLALIGKEKALERLEHFKKFLSRTC